MRVFLICRRRAGKDGFSLLLKGGKVLPKGERPRLRDCYKTEAAAKAAITRLSRTEDGEKERYIYSVSEYNYG